MIERAVVFSRGKTIRPEHLQLGSGETDNGRAGELAGLFEFKISEAKEEFFSAYLEHHLKRCYGVVAEFNRQTGITRNRIYEWLKQNGKEADDFR